METGVWFGQISDLLINPVLVKKINAQGPFFPNHKFTKSSIHVAFKSTVLVYDYGQYG